MDKIPFQNLPNTTTPVNATNLNQMQTNIDNAKMEKMIEVTTTGTDCNNYTENGIYWFGSSSVLPSNSPFSGIYGWLEVIATTNGSLIRQIWHRSAVINGTNEFQTYVRFYNSTSQSWSNWDRYVMRNEVDELNVSTDSVVASSTWSKTLANGTYLIVIARTNGASAGGLYIVNIANNSYLTTINPYSSGTLTLTDKTLSITPNVATEATVIKLAGR